MNVCSLCHCFRACRTVSLGRESLFLICVFLLNKPVLVSCCPVMVTLLKCFLLNDNRHFTADYHRVLELDKNNKQAKTEIERLELVCTCSVS